MKLIVITNPEEVKKEAEKITALFEEGLELLHCRKPEWDSVRFEGFLKTIPSKYYKKIVIHSHYKLIEKYNLKGIHLTGAYRKLIDDKILQELFKTIKKKNITISTSFHSVEELKNNKWKYDYVFLSPLFDSISKKNHFSEFDIVEVKNVLEEYKAYPKVIALGGIDENTIKSIGSIGFAGAALLGVIWRTDEVVEKFNQLKKTIAL